MTKQHDDIVEALKDSTVGMTFGALARKLGWNKLRLRNALKSANYHGKVYCEGRRWKVYK